MNIVTDPASAEVDFLPYPASTEASIAPVTADTDSFRSATETLPVVTLPKQSNFNPYYDKNTPQLTGRITRATVLKVTHVLQTFNCPFNPVDCVPPSERSQFQSLLQRRYSMDPVKRAECRLWETWSVDRFCEELKEAVPNVTEAQAQIMGFIEAITRVKINFDMQQPSLEEETDRMLNDIMDAHPEVTPAQELEAVAILKKRLPDSPTNWRGVLTRKIGGKFPVLDSVEAFRFVWLQQLKLSREQIATTNLLGGKFEYNSTSRQYSVQPKSLLSQDKTDTASTKRGRSEITDDTPALKCTGCGRDNHSKATCKFTSSKYFNKGGGKYIDSTGYALLIKERPKHTDLTLPRDSLVKSFPTSSSSSSSSSSATTAVSQNKEQALKRKGTSIISVIVPDISIPPDPIPNYKYFFLSLVSDKLKKPLETNKVETLLDTGSLAGNFVLRQVLIDLHLTSDILPSPCPSTVCSGLDNSCYSLNSTIILQLSYFCSIINNYASFSVQAFILDNSPLKLIIGLQSIRELNLFHLFPECWS